MKKTLLTLAALTAVYAQELTVEDSQESSVQKCMQVLLPEDDKQSSELKRPLECPTDDTVTKQQRLPGATKPTHKRQGSR